MTQRNARAARPAPKAEDAPAPSAPSADEVDGRPRVQPQIHPVFEGLGLAGLTAKKIARISGVSALTILEWRAGREPAPPGRVVFLTLLLTHMVDELVRTYDQWGPAPKAWHLHMQGCLEKAQALLGRQEGKNEGVPAAAFHKGERLFAEWLELDTARNEAAEAARRVAQGLDTTGIDF